MKIKTKLSGLCVNVYSTGRVLPAMAWYDWVDGREYVAVVEWSMELNYRDEFIDSPVFLLHSLELECTEDGGIVGEIIDLKGVKIALEMDNLTLKDWAANDGVLQPSEIYIYINPDTKQITEIIIE